MKQALSLRKGWWTLSWWVEHLFAAYFLRSPSVASYGSIIHICPDIVQVLQSLQLSHYCFLIWRNMTTSCYDKRRWKEWFPSTTAFISYMSTFLNISPLASTIGIFSATDTFPYNLYSTPCYLPRNRIHDKRHDFFFRKQTIVGLTSAP